MVIKLPVTQIAEYWSLIKLCGIQSDSIRPQDTAKYCKNLLCDIYSDKLMVLLKIDSGRQIEAIGFVEFKQDPLTERKLLNVRNLYGLKPIELESWQEIGDQIRKLADREGCDRLEARSGNTRVWDILSKMGFKEDYRSYGIDL